MGWRVPGWGTFGGTADGEAGCRLGGVWGDCGWGGGLPVGWCLEGLRMGWRVAGWVASRGEPGENMGECGSGEKRRVEEMAGVVEWGEWVKNAAGRFFAGIRKSGHNPVGWTRGRPAGYITQNKIQAPWPNFLCRL